ncbi:MAG: Maf family protein [Clostridiaceae bacterium]|nr:Maf family protein [Clostridiaceae bacterium]
MLILASGSPRRKQLLGLITDKFDVRPTGCDETLLCADPDKRVLELALRKAHAAALLPGDAILAADTIVALDGEILEKPSDEADAYRMLRLLSGRTHTVYTGVAVRTEETVKSFCQKTDVTFWELDDAFIDAYIRSGEPMDKAGAYGIQGRGALLVQNIEGDFFNVMGLPVAAVYRLLRELGLAT